MHGAQRTVLFMLFVGVVVRLVLHDVHGLEGDDAFSLAISRTPTPALVVGLLRLELDVHPPLHFLMLKGWVALAGESLLSLRLLNILLSTLTGALMVRLVALAGGGRPAQRAVIVLWAVAPLLVFGEWLVRMYTLLGLLATAAAVFALLGTPPRPESEPRGEVKYVLLAALTCLLALYTHALGMIVYVAVGVVCVGAVWGAWRRAAVTVVAFGVVGALYLPFALNALTLTQSVETLGAQVNPAFAGALPLWEQAGRILWAGALHRVNPLPLGYVLALVGFAGVLMIATAQQTRPAIALVALSALTFAGLVAIVLSIGFKPRYVVPFVPLWAALIALVGGKSLFGRALVTVLALMMVGSLAGNTRYGWRDDWTAAANYMATYSLPGDAVLVVPDWGQEAMRYHYAGDAPVRGFFPQITPALDLDAAFADYVDGHGRVWLVRYQPDVSDPDNLAAAWLDARGTPITQAYPAGMEITLFDLGLVADALPPTARPLDVQFGDVLALRGVTVPPTLSTPAINTRLYDESGRVLVALHWRALQPNITQTPRVRLTDTFGQVYGGALPPPADAAPVASWQPGDVVTVYYDLNLNPQTPPGTYNVEVMVLDETGAPLPSTGADAGEYWAVAGQWRVR